MKNIPSWPLNNMFNAVFTFVNVFFGHFLIAYQKAFFFITAMPLKKILQRGKCWLSFTLCFVVIDKDVIE